jgi:dGTPase
MKWEHLFNPNRIGVQYSKEIDLLSTRSSFAKDYDRILFSAPFRKLQNKTQVFPLTDNIFVHNRLTHSLETASVGKTLGGEVGNAIAAKGPQEPVFQYFYQNELQNVIAAACLAHDIGNPPFGHAGESALSEYFKNLPQSVQESIRQELTDAQWKEISHFEGNANGFRILTHPFNNPNGGEFKLTYSTLAAMVKYPCQCVDGNDKSKAIISAKKYNIFETEWAAWQKLSNAMHMETLPDYSTIYQRHPFVFLTEAADDICYLIIDLEDAHRLKIIPHTETVNHFIGLLEAFDLDFEIPKTVQNIVAEDHKIAYLRALVISKAIQTTVAVFMEHEKDLLNGTLNQSLTSLFPEAIKKKWKALENYSLEHIYRHPMVVHREMAGYTILQGLLGEFLQLVFQPESLRSKQLRSLIPYSFQNKENPDSLYLNLRAILDFISAMTDQEAMDLFRLLKGIKV